MKAIIEIPIRTREVNQLFTRKINKDKLFIEAILHKFNKCYGYYNKNPSKGLELLSHLETKLSDMITQFKNTKEQYEQLLQKNKELSNKIIEFKSQFRPKMIISNKLGRLLVEYIDCYDQLTATIKLLYLAGCFVSDQDYYSHVRRVQNDSNKFLSGLMLVSVNH